MIWFGFGFNGFSQISAVASNGEPGEITSENVELKVVVPTKLADCRALAFKLNSENDENVEKARKVRASWSLRAVLQLGDEPHEQRPRCCVARSRGCRDALVAEGRLTLAFADRTECWNLDQMEDSPVWKMEHETVDGAGLPPALPLVPGGYVIANPPFFRSLSPQLCAVSLSLGTEHAVLLNASGVVYTWGSSSHGQLGHGGLGREEEPRVVEALWGMAMAGVAAGGWHSVCVSAGGDVYTWGWNESGQLGLPARGLRSKRGHNQGVHPQEGEGASSTDVFISIQAFPALVDLPHDPEITKVSCGSRHTAAITRTADLFTWGWGDYGQLGQGATYSSDQPVRVDFFTGRGLRVVDVVCGPWNTFVSVVESECFLS